VLHGPKATTFVSELLNYEIIVCRLIKFGWLFSVHWWVIPLRMEHMTEAKFALRVGEVIFHLGKKLLLKFLFISKLTSTS